MSLSRYISATLTIMRALPARMRGDEWMHLGAILVGLGTGLLVAWYLGGRRWT